MKPTRLAALCSGALVAMTACQVDHSIGRRSYEVRFLIRDDDPTGSEVLLDVRVSGDARLRSGLDLSCDDFPYGLDGPLGRGEELALQIPLLRRRAGESYTCSVSSDEGVRTFRLPHVDAPPLDSPPAGAIWHVTEPFDLAWSAPESAVETLSSSTSIKLRYCGGIGQMWTDMPDAGVETINDPTLIGLSPSCSAEATITRSWSIRLRSEVESGVDPGFEDANYTFTSERTNAFLFEN